ncbi:hypothetical protein SLS62_006053 [Diatrype stigma]|uniref:Uncharacterized protein n=1 Tax=Diatrype stigma TaxID=117547 RepID=A0AAN9YRP1_9PEZI
MKPIVGAMQAWSCVVISVFAIVILSILGGLFRTKHHEFVGGIEDPEDGPAVAGTIFTAVIVYAVRRDFPVSESNRSPRSLPTSSPAMT